MTTRFRSLQKRLSNVKEFNEIWLKPHIGSGKVGGQKNGQISFLSRVKILARGTPRSGGTNRRSRARGGGQRSKRKFLQRVVIKSRVVKTNHAKPRGLELHVQYIQRNGVGINGKEPDVFNEERILAPDEVQDWVQSCSENRHHFRFIISPENGSELDLKAHARQVMSQMEKDLETPLSWIGVTHHNTDNPHVHIILKGTDTRGQDLVISRDYISHGMRLKAQEAATRELGPRSELDVKRDLTKSVTQSRLVGLDFKLRDLSDAHPNGFVDLSDAKQFKGSGAPDLRRLQLGRLQFLERLELARGLAPGVWELDENLFEKLRELGMRNDIIKTMHRRMSGIHAGTEVSIVDPEKPPERSIEGKVVDVGLADELYDKKYLILEDGRGKLHYLSMSEGSVQSARDFDVGSSVSVSFKQVRSRGVLRNVFVLKGLEHGHAFDLKQEL